MIYLDSPAGVGLSYSETRGDYITNDTHTAADADVFLRRFFRRYPEFLRNDLFIAGTALPLSRQGQMSQTPGYQGNCIESSASAGCVYQDEEDAARRTLAGIFMW